MSRKVTIIVKTETMVPVIAEIRATVIVDEGVDMQDVARAVVYGKVPDSMTVEDSGIETVYVHNHDGEEEETLSEQLRDYMQSDKASVRRLDHRIEDSR